MAAYAATVTLRSPKVIKQLGGVGILFGSIDLTNYNATLAELTGITSKFKAATLQVILGGVSDNGYIVAWDATAKAVKAWYPSRVRTHNHDLLVIGGQGDQIGGAPNIVSCVQATAILGKEEVTNATMAKADVATKGGVVSETLAAGAGTEVASDVDVGAVSFIAIGLVGG